MILSAHFQTVHHTPHLIVRLQTQVEVPAPGKAKSLRKRIGLHLVMQVIFNALSVLMEDLQLSCKALVVFICSLAASVP